MREKMRHFSTEREGVGKEKTLPLEQAEMYALPGEKLTQKDRERYIKTTENTEKEIKEHIRCSEGKAILEKEDYILRIAFFNELSQEQQETFLEDILSNERIPRIYDVHTDAHQFSLQDYLFFLKNIPKEMMIHAVKRVLKSNRSKQALQHLFELAAENTFLEEVFPEEVFELMYTHPERKNISYMVIQASAFWALINNHFPISDTMYKNLPDDLSMYTYVRILHRVSKEKRKEIFEKIFASIHKESSDDRRKMIDRLYKLATKEELTYFSEYFDRHEVIQKEASVPIEKGPEENPSFIAQRLFADSDNEMSPQMQHALTALIEFLPKEDRFSAIEQLILSDDEHVVDSAIEKSILLSPEERGKIFDNILFGHGKKRVRAIALLLEQCSEEERKKYIPFIFKNPFFSEGASVLYYGSAHPFYRKNFAKTGSGITLLDRVLVGKDEEGNEKALASLREKVIIRHLRADSAFLWKKIYEAGDIWRDAGFSYVPIEPIVSMQYEKSGKISVYTRVLPGPSLGMYNNFSGGLYKKTLKELRQRIMATLQENNWCHGHLHDKNFVVVFEKDAQGKIIKEKPPRLYCIDFDEVRPAFKEDIKEQDELARYHL